MKRKIEKAAKICLLISAAILFAGFLIGVYMAPSVDPNGKAPAFLVDLLLLGVTLAVISAAAGAIIHRKEVSEFISKFINNRL